ncbi:hypothetical protein GLE_1884 [Lysobacter enzymogenes]|uniref:Uncharacterized protein n=1 Tax=Lysobacter enzymogenes TaxID=69 RepID=A0A0S2DF76_LYSEN|nr:hypothetical protein GLE_1884 [Lysobacter enzymogenes]
MRERVHRTVRRGLRRASRRTARCRRAKVRQSFQTVRRTAAEPVMPSPSGFARRRSGHSG